MNLFAIGTASERGSGLEQARQAMDELAAALPGLGGRHAETWSSPRGDAVAVSLSHDPERAGGVRYTCFEEDRMALYAGRPIAWTGDGEADGRGPLDPRFYFAPAEGWRSAIDGRYAVARWTSGGGAAEVFTDALGAYPVYATEGQGSAWVGNSPALLARLVGSSELSAEVLTSFFACGWSLSGDPVWARVRRVPRATRVTLARGTLEERSDVLPPEELASFFSSRFDAARAGRAIAGAAGALADWPGRPSEVAITGGRDSRLALAGAMGASLTFTAMTKAFPGQDGYPDTADVVVARRVCEELGVEHRVVRQESGTNPLSDPARAAALLAVTGPATVSLGDSLELPLEGAPDPFPVLLGGQGAEVAKGAYGSGGSRAEPGLLADKLLGKASPAYPPRLVDADGERLVGDWLTAWVAEQIEYGAPTAEIPTLFHLLVRLGTWGGAGLTSRDVGLDTTSPMWTTRLLPHQVSLPLAERQAGAFYQRVLEELSPRLAALPYERASKGARAKLLKEARRRFDRRLSSVGGREGGPDPDPFPSAFADIREAVMTQRDHAAWAVLRERRVRRLLARDPGTLDPRSRQQVLRLGTVFLSV